MRAFTIKKIMYQKNPAGFSAKRHYSTLEQKLFLTVTSPPYLILANFRSRWFFLPQSLTTRDKKE
jgi:hypothetical protein